MHPVTKVLLYLYRNSCTQPVHSVFCTCVVPVLSIEYVLSHADSNVSFHTLFTPVVLVLSPAYLHVVGMLRFISSNRA